MSAKQVRFNTTSWSLLGQLHGPDANSALSELCQQYWQPLYAFARQRTNSVHAAQDQTQAFFHQLISKNSLRQADRDRGRFRTFLLAAFKNFLANEHARETAALRGGGQSLLPLDFVDAEETYQRNRIETASPDVQFDRAWTLQLIDRVIELLRNEYLEQGAAARFDVLKPALTFATDQTTAEIAEQLGLSAVATRKAISRLRQQFRERLKAEVTRLVHDSDEVDDEIQLMFRSLSS